MRTFRQQFFDRLDRARIATYQHQQAVQMLALDRAQARLARASAGGRDYI